MKWPTGPLDSIAILDRQSIHPSQVDAATPYLGLAHLDGDGGINCVETVGSANLRSNKFQFSDRHVLFGKLRPYLRKIVRPGFSGVCSTDIIPILPKEGMSRDYLFYFLRAPHTVNLATSRSSGANLPRLAPKQLASFQVPLPSLAEQERIAGILNAADALRAKRRESIAQCDTLLQSVFLDMFGDPDTNPMGWQNRPFGDITAARKLGLVRSSKEFGWDFRIPYVRMDAVTASGKFLPEKVQRTEADERELKDYRLKPGDFLFNTRNSKQLVGKVCVFPGPEGWLFNNNLMRIRFCAEVEPTVIAMQFRFGRVQRELEKRKSGTTSVFAVYWKSLQTLPVLVPTSDLQRRFAAIVKSVERQKARQQAHLAELNTLFASLQSRAFRGEL